MLKWILFVLLVSTQQLIAQPACKYPPINESLLLQTKWKYTFTTHQATNTVIHKADKNYLYYIFFRYDNVLETSLNGKWSAQNWAMNSEKNTLLYDFRKIDRWEIAEFTDHALVLEYTLYGKIAYRYHFVSVPDADAPFERQLTDLPDVRVDYANAKADKYKYRNVRAEKGKRWFWQRSKKDKNAPSESIKILPEAPTFMQIELVGGGYRGGIDKVYRNNLVIKTDGLVIQEFQSEVQGLRVTKKQIPRKTVEELVAFIEKHHFLEFQQSYNCQTADCAHRLQKKPAPIALRLALTHGARRKVITVGIWDGTGYQNSLINYPPELDTIVRTIQNVVN